MAVMGCLLAGAAAQSELDGLSEPYSPPPAYLLLQPAGEKQAEALALFYKGKRLEREVGGELTLKTYREALALQPTNVALAEYLAKLLAEGGKFTEALQVVEQCLARNPKSVGAYLAVSRHCLRHHHDAEEIKSKGMQYANQAVEKFPGSAAAYGHLISTYFQVAGLLEGDPMVKARVLLDRALLAKSEEPEFYLALVSQAIRVYPLQDKATREDHLGRILTFADRALETSKGVPEILEQVADVQARLAGQLQMASLFEKALPLLRNVVKARPENLTVRHKLAGALLRTGKQADAAAEYEELVRINPQDMEAHRALAKLCAEKKDFKAAMRHRQELLRWEGGAPNDFLTLTADMLEQDLNVEALNMVKRARANFPDDARFPYQMGLIHRLEKRQEEALECFQEARLLAGRLNEGKEHQDNAALLKNPDFYYAWAGVAATVGKRNLAADLYRKSIDVSPKDQPAKMARCYNDLGYLWLENDEKLEEAGELIRTANQLVGDSPGYLDSLGWFQLKKENPAEALKQFEKAVSLLKTPDPEVLDHMAQALWQIGRRAEAIAKLETAVRLEDASEAMRKRLAKYREATKTP